MAIKSYKPDEIRAVVSKNRLRQYPGVNKGKERLLPYARPQILTETSVPEDASYFVVGNCFGRNVEKALARAGRTVLSSPTDLDLPGSAQEQFNRFNIFNLDVSTNEIDWAINPNAKPLDDALIEVDGEWVDMQIHWTFAHDEAQAKQYRKVYNSSYAGISKADVVIVALSGVEQWYDTKTGLYLNGMPTKKMVEQSEGRYEFHRLDLDACVESLSRFCKVVKAYSEKDPLILVAVSPVSQPVVHTLTDSIVDQYLVKAIQRNAADIVCEASDRIEYLPALEAAMLSDFRYGYMRTSLNHTIQCLANRVVAEMLLKYEGESDGQRLLHAVGHVEALLLAEDYDAAIETAEEVIGSSVGSTDELDQFYTKALIQSKRHGDALSYMIQRLLSGEVSDEQRVLFSVLNLASGHGTEEQLDLVEAFGQDRGLDVSQVEAVRQAWANRKAAGGGGGKGQHSAEVAAIVALMKEEDNEAVVSGCLSLLNRKHELTAAEHDRVMNYLVHGLIRLGRQIDAISHLADHVATEEAPTPRRVQLLVNLARSHADAAMLDRVIELRDRIGDAGMIGQLEARRALLNAR